jgi:tetratricopeptide (TPR) repeat protein
MVLGAGPVLGRPMAVGWVCRTAEAEIDRGALGAAEAWLDVAVRWSPPDPRILLVQAACARHWGDRERWKRALTRAEQSGGPPERVGLERSLGQVQWGEFEESNSAAGEYDALRTAGASPRDAATSVIQGLLATQQTAAARHLLATWTDEISDPSQVSYLLGLILWRAGELDAAESELERAIEGQPNHDPAHASLAHLLEQLERFPESLGHYWQVAAVAPSHEDVQLGLARVLRKQGRVAEARQVLPAPADPDQVSELAAVEFAVREYETGNYAESRRWYQRVDLEKGMWLILCEPPPPPWHSAETGSRRIRFSAGLITPNIIPGSPPSCSGG